MSEILLKGVSKKYMPQTYAVQNVDLTINDGEFFILLGPSGCGKSTTLRMIAGLEAISEGELFIDGHPMTDVDPADRDLAFVFQNYALYPHMSVAKNLGFGLKLRGINQAEIRRRIAETSEMLGISDLLDRKPKALSGGQQQRVALGRALVREPVAFLLDEPLSNLDTKLRAAMRTELIKLHNKFKMTIVHVTHDHVEAMTMGDRICIMNDGSIVQTGPPLEVYQNPVNTFVAGFLASPPMNLIPSRIEGSGEALRVIADGLSLPIPKAYVQAYQSYVDREVIFGIRPEDLAESQAAPALPTMDVETVSVEAMGPETILIGALRDSFEISARMPRNFRIPFGHKQSLAVDMCEMHIFDPETTSAVQRPRANS